MRNRFQIRLLALPLFCAALGGCAIAPRWVQPFDESEVIAPLPTFVSVHDCELAYGAGACGTGSQVYGQASLAAPPGADQWYMPYSFGPMTGALLHDHYTPPGPYLAQAPYWSFVQPAMVQRYALVTPQTLRFDRSDQHPFQGGAHAPSAWQWQLRREPAMRPAYPRLLNPPPVAPTPPTQLTPSTKPGQATSPQMPFAPGSGGRQSPDGGFSRGQGNFSHSRAGSPEPSGLSGPLGQNMPTQPIPQKSSPLPASMNLAPNLGPRPDRLDRPGPANNVNRSGDRKPEDKK